MMAGSLGTMQWIEIPYQILPSADPEGYPVDHRAAIALHPNRVPIIISVSLTLDGAGLLQMYRQDRPHGENCECWVKVHEETHHVTLQPTSTAQEMHSQMAGATGQWLDTLKASFFQSDHLLTQTNAKGDFQA